MLDQHLSSYYPWIRQLLFRAFLGFVNSVAADVAVIELQHIQASEAMAVITPFLKTEDILERHGQKLFLEAPRTQIERLKTLIAHLDVAPRQLHFTLTTRDPQQHYYGQAPNQLQATLLSGEDMILITTKTKPILQTISGRKGYYHHQKPEGTPDNTAQVAADLTRFEQQKQAISRLEHSYRQNQERLKRLQITENASGARPTEAEIDTQRTLLTLENQNILTEITELLRLATPLTQGREVTTELTKLEEQIATKTTELKELQTTKPSEQTLSHTADGLIHYQQQQQKEGFIIRLEALAEKAIVHIQHQGQQAWSFTMQVPYASWEKVELPLTAKPQIYWLQVILKD